MHKSTSNFIDVKHRSVVTQKLHILSFGLYTLCIIFSDLTRNFKGVSYPKGWTEDEI